ncbi:TlpA family protein disulfide reductase [Aureispira anguillae]|uniref:TlpA family protein disulfide reductase n=1 Tax=Aureispira anguillae TaxID=2864201 RepID=A0A916DRG6_9BACT|nr:TlpA disulfide reductase family protein [Aureispira anguillae]BDS10645.1 TlpA family protein disulfide reductase [Aureispira anguillae]
MENIKQKHHIGSFDVKTTEGTNVKFGEGSDKPTLLVLFTTWCSSCLEATPAISQKFEHLKGQINLVGIGREHNAAELEEWSQKEGLAYDLVEDPSRELFNKFADLHVPRMYLIDTDGTVKYQDVNWHPLMLEDMEEAIQALLEK